MDVDVQVVVRGKTTEDAGIGCGYLLAVEPFKSGIVNSLRNSKRDAALGETKPANDVGILAALYKLVLANDADIRHSAGYTLRNIIVTEIKNLKGEIARLNKQSATRTVYLYTCLF